MLYKFDKSTVCSDKGFCYIIEFSDGVIKPGRTKNLLARFKQHKSDANKHGLEVLRVAFTSQYENYEDIEMEMLSKLRPKASKNIGEYMTGIMFDDCIRLMSEIGYVLNISSEIIDKSKKPPKPQKPKKPPTNKASSEARLQPHEIIELTGEITMEEFTKLSGYSAITVAQAILYKPNRRAAIMAKAMGLVYERSDLVRLAAPRKKKAIQEEAK